MNHSNFKIGNIQVGMDQTPLVIPEIGINHNGSLDIAKEMVASAHRTGARLIKHQTHIIKDEMSSVAKNVIPGNSDLSIYEIMSRCALNEEEERELKRYTESLGMVFLSTPFSRAAANRLEDFGVTAYKIGSGEMNNYPLLDYISSFGKPMIVSTGMNDLTSIDKAITILEKRNVPYALLHTTNLYPTKAHQIRLGAMTQLMDTYPDIPIGLSDHSINNNACKASLALHATIVERHFTDKKERIGPDIVCSMDEAELRDLILAAKEIPLMLDGEKKALPEEQVTIDFAFSTLVTIADIKAGETFTVDNLWVKRPGTGEIHAKYFDNVLGHKATMDIKNDTQLTKIMIESFR